MTANTGRAAGRRQGGSGDGAAGDDTDPTPLPDSYETARDELAEVVAALEEGGLTLDESLALWERGQMLAAACERFLAGARARVQEALDRAEEPDPDDDPAR